MRETMEEVKREVSNLKTEEKSFAMEMLSDYKRQNKRLFVIILVILTFWFATIGYLVYILNDIGIEVVTQEITDVESIGGSVTNKGDIYGED